MTRVFASCLLGLMLVLLLIFTASAQVLYRVSIINRAGDAITTLADGDLVQLSIELSQGVQEPATISFYLDRETHHLADCQIPAGERRCITAPVSTLGWYWNEDQEVEPVRNVYAINYVETGWQHVASQEIVVHSRPVVLVHGFGSSAIAWEDYLGPSGYLALMGLRGYAVGDGQVTGTMYTGRLLNPPLKTNTIAGNAAALGEYIANIKAKTGAEQVDLIAHSMGGLISRYYIDRLMEQRDVAQLIMLGTPNGGSDCALLIGSLGMYQPAGLELRSSYIRNVFNPQITETRDVPFHLFAGTPIRHGLLSPCSAIPNDMVVSLDSAAAFPAELVEVPVLHTELTNSEELFINYVALLLRRSGSEFVSTADQAVQRSETEENAIQFSQVYTGMVTNAQGNIHTIHIDNDVAVASFGLYDPSRTLTVTVRGASGNVITLTPEAHGLTVVNDPATLFYLGYGFANPNPGPWQVTVHPTHRTPPLGTQYALMANYMGGASIEASLSNHLPGVAEEVELTATLRLGDDTLPITIARVVLLDPDGYAEAIPLVVSDTGIEASLQPEQAGIYGLDVSLRSQLPDGAVVERSAYLAFEAFDDPPEIRR